MFDLPPSRKHELARCMPILEARDRLKQEVADDDVYDLWLLATGSEEEASKAFENRIAYRLRRNEKPDVRPR